MPYSVIVKQKLFRIAEIVHLRIFGHEMSDEMRRFVSNLSIVFLGSTLSSVLLLFVNLFSARVLGPSDFGKFQLVMTIGQFFLIFMLMGLSTASVQYLARQEKSKKDVTIFSVLAVSAVSVFCISITALYFSEGASVLFGVTKPVLIIGVYLAGALTLYQITRSFLQGYKMMGTLSYLDFVYALVIAATVIGGFFVGSFSTYSALSMAFIFGYISYGVLVMYKLLPKIKASFSFEKIKTILHYAWYAFLGSVTGFLLNNMDRLWLNHYFASDVVGIYSAYMLVASVIFGQLTQIFVTVFFPTVSGYADQTAVVEKIRKSEVYILLVVPLISFLASIVIFKIIGFDFNVLYGLVFSFNSGLMVLWQVKMWLFNSRGVNGVKIVVYSSFVVGIINLLMCAALIPKFGILGAGLAVTASSIILYCYYTRRLVTQHLVLINS